MNRPPQQNAGATPPAGWDAATHRRRALCSALLMWADDAHRLAELHPEATGVGCECRDDVPTTIDRLLWDELEARESRSRRAAGNRRAPSPTPRTAAAYWNRRRKLALAGELAALVRVLPDLWRVLMDRRPDEVEQFAVRVGLAALALRPADDESQPSFDEDTRLRVRKTASRLDGATFDPEITAAWRTAFEKQAAKGDADRALRALGMSVLAGVYEHLPHPTRAAMARHFQSSLCTSLAAGRPLRRLSPGQALELESVLAGVAGNAPPTTPRSAD